MSMNSELVQIYYIINGGKMVSKPLINFEEDKKIIIGIALIYNYHVVTISLFDKECGSQLINSPINDIPGHSLEDLLDTEMRNLCLYGENSTQKLKPYLKFDLEENQYIPSTLQLRLLYRNLKIVNEALIEAGGDPLLRERSYISSTVSPDKTTWVVDFKNGLFKRPDIVSNCFLRTSIILNNLDYRNIKTFEDAYDILSSDNSFYSKNLINEFDSYVWDNETSQLISYLKLRIIVRALNDGWYPSPTSSLDFGGWINQLKLIPSSIISTQELGIIKIFKGKYNYTLKNGEEYYLIGDISRRSHIYSNSELTFKPLELAQYALEKFHDIYEDYQNFKILF